MDGEKLAGECDLVMVRLSQGKHAIIDRCDIPLIQGLTWSASENRRGHWYATTRHNGKTVFMHRLLLENPPSCVDHINGNGLDNRRSNLRVASAAQNNWNRRPQGLASPFKGVVSSGSASRPWKAEIYGKGVRRSLGNHLTQEDAARAYDSAAREAYGEFAYLNFPEGARNE